MATNFSVKDDAQSNRNAAPVDASSTVTVTQPGSTNSAGQRSARSDQTQNPLRTDLRQYNPLSKLSSWNYILTLYIVTPECANYFAENGVLPTNNDDGRWFIIAQSGGIDSQSEPRALTNDPQGRPGIPFGGLDFFIDDLNIETILFAQDGQKTATYSYDFSFKIIEPIGFTFLTKLSRASQQINELSKLITSGVLSSRPNLYQQHYMIGIKFYGYDENGNIQIGQNFERSPISLSDPYGIYERLFPIVVKQVNFRVGAARETVYNFAANMINLQVGFGVKRAVILGNPELQGSSVGEVLGNAQSQSANTLMGWLNGKQKTLKDQNYQSTAQKYDIDWGTDPESQAIKNSQLITLADYEPMTAAMSQAQSTQQVNPKTAQTANAVNTLSKIIGVAPGVNVAQIIDQVIVRSKYIADVLLAQNTQDVESKSKKETPGKLKWYTINPNVKIMGRDSKNSDWSYEITYQIRPYEIAHIRSQYVQSKSRYYGPIKKYNYLFTGGNTEIISFDIDYNNLYYTVVTPSTGVNPLTNRGSQDPNIPSSVNGAVDSNKTSGQINNGSAIVNNVRANLYSILDAAKASIRIMGDPDYLMTTVGAKLPESASFGKFYSRDWSINPYGGQLFIEIVFKVAEDYKNNGLLDVDDSQTVLFFPPALQAEIKNEGLIFRVNKVTSSFSRGKFEQNLDLFIVPPSELLYQAPAPTGGADLYSDLANAAEQPAAVPAAAAQSGANVTPQRPPQRIPAGYGWEDQ